MHPRNIHRDGYDIKQLVSAHPALSNHIIITQRGQQSIDFADPTAVITLNQALLKHHYNIDFWTTPSPFLCPPIPGRVDYIHHLAEFLESQPDFVSHDKIKMLDIGTGASAIYPILGRACYQWQCVGSDINPTAIKFAKQWSEFNNLGLRFRHQSDAKHYFKDIIKTDEQFTVTVCNPPFHASESDAKQGTERKWRNLKGTKQSKLNFGGHAPELWCEGGEIAFVSNMMKESQQFSTQVKWFTCLLSKGDNVKPLEKLANTLNVSAWHIINMEQGNKQSRFIVWGW